MFGENELIDRFSAVANKSCDEIIKTILENVNNYSANEIIDDMTLVAVKCVR